MGAFRNAVFIMFRRPFIILFLSIITLVLCAIDYINPFSKILFNYSGIIGGNFFESFVSSLQIILSPSFILAGILIITGLFLIISIAAGLLFSGYFNIINNSLDGKPKFKGEFAYGFRKYFFKVTAISFRVLFIGFILIMFLAVAAIPGVVITRTLILGKTGYLALTILVDIITAGVLFFAVMFFSIYVSFWYPAAINFEKNAYSIGKQTADSYFWPIVGKFLIFDLVYIITMVFLAYGGKLFSVQLVFIVNWVFKTFFFAAFITFIFSSYKILRENVE
jgi:hypothetical protein